MSIDHKLLASTSLDQLWETFEARRREAPAVTIEALMIVLRRDGLAGLKQAVNRERLAELDRRQLRNVVDRLRSPRMSCYRAWADAEIAQFVKLWGAVR